MFLLIIKKSQIKEVTHIFLPSFSNKCRLLVIFLIIQKCIVSKKNISLTFFCLLEWGQLTQFSIYFSYGSYYQIFYYLKYFSKYKYMYIYIDTKSIYQSLNDQISSLLLCITFIYFLVGRKHTICLVVFSSFHIKFNKCQW